MKRGMRAALLTAAGAFALWAGGCGDTVQTGPDYGSVDSTEESDQIVVHVIGSSGADISGAKITLYRDGTALDNTLTVPSVSTDTASVTFTGMSQGSYIAAVNLDGSYVARTALATLVGYTPADAYMRLDKISGAGNGSTVTVSTGTVSGATNLTVGQPSYLNQGNDGNTVPITVGFDGSPVTGDVTLVGLTGMAAPLIQDATGAVSTVVLSAVQILYTPGAGNASESVSVSLPIPAKLSDTTAVAGGTLPVYRFNPSTMQWSSVATATVTTTSSGPVATAPSVTLAGSSTILAVAVAPTQNRTSSTTDLIGTIEPLELADTLQYLQANNLEYMLDQLPVAAAISKPAASPFYPFGSVSARVWQYTAPLLIGSVPQIEGWIRTGQAFIPVDIPDVFAVMQTFRTQEQYSFSFKLGSLTRTHVIQADYSYATIQKVEIPDEQAATQN